MSKRQVFELCIKDIRLNKIESARPAGGSRLLTAVLIWPRPAIAERAAVLPITLDKAHSAAFESSAWSHRILFKEQVEGPFGLKISVTERLPDPRLAELMAMFGQAAMNVAIRDVTGLSGPALASGLLQTPLRYAHKLMGGAAKQSPRIIAEGVLDLDIVGTWQQEITREITVKLQAPETVTTRRLSQRDGKPAPGRNKTVLRSGEDNGEVVLSGLLRA